MRVIIDLRQYQNKSELLDALIDELGLDPARVVDLDSLYEDLIKGSGELDIIFTHKADLSKSLSVYFGMLTMTIEEVAEARRDLRTETYYDEEDASGIRQKDL